MKNCLLQKSHSCPLDGAFIDTTALHEFAESLGAAVDAKDPNTRQHSEEVAVVSHTLALELGLSPSEADIIHVAAHLHDVGKIGVPDAVLLKAGPLTAAEWDIMRQHPVIGAEIVHPVTPLCQCGVLEMILHHHERYDGTGYPNQLQGEDIPIGARIIALADSLSAMLQSRPYRLKMMFEEAHTEILHSAGTQLDPWGVSCFFRIKDLIRQQLEILSCEKTTIPARNIPELGTLLHDGQCKAAAPSRHRIALDNNANREPRRVPSATAQTSMSRSASSGIHDVVNSSLQQS